VFSEHFAHGAGRRLTGQAVDVDLLLFVLLAQQLPPARLRVHTAGGDREGRDGSSSVQNVLNSM